MADPNIQIAGRQGLRDIEQYNFTIYEALRYRVAEYEDFLGINSELSPRNMSIEPRLMNDLVNRKAIILAETATKYMLTSLHVDMNLMESENKYNSIFRYSYVSKNITQHKDVFKL